MPVLVDFVLYTAEDGTLGVAMSPPTPVGGWTLQFTMTRRLGGTPIITKSVASGFNGASGITVVNSGAGQFNVALHPADVSGVDPGAYWYQVQRLDSGFATCVSEGSRLMPQ